jgi:hypothetical protein
MNKWARLQAFESAGHWTQSGLHRKTGASRFHGIGCTEAQHHDDSNPLNLGELWQSVAYWISQMAPGDPRRRLLELAQLRHDSKLAGAVLRHL